MSGFPILEVVGLGGCRSTCRAMGYQKSRWKMPCSEKHIYWLTLTLCFFFSSGVCWCTGWHTMLKRLQCWVQISVRTDHCLFSVWWDHLWQVLNLSDIIICLCLYYIFANRIEWATASKGKNDQTYELSHWNTEGNGRSSSSGKQRTSWWVISSYSINKTIKSRKEWSY